MSRNNNYQQIQELASSLPSSTKDIVCSDCGGISATKVQQLLSTLEGTTQLFNTTSLSNGIDQKKRKSISGTKKKNSARNNSQKNSLRQNKTIRKRISTPTKQRKLNRKQIRSSRNNNNNKIQLKSKKIK